MTAPGRADAVVRSQQGGKARGRGRPRALSLCRPFRVVALAVFSAAYLGFAPPLSSDEPRFGINRVNIAWLSASERRERLDDMAAAGVALVRLSLSEPYAASFDALRIADAHGMRILLEIPLTRGDFVRAGAQRRSGQGRAWDVYGLSDIELATFRNKLRKALRTIDSLGISLAAIELGNEINWAPFNGDLHVHPEPGVRTARSVSELQDRYTFERGLDTYVMLTAITRYELRGTRHNREAQIISAGLSDISASLADRHGLERLDAADVIEMLRARGIDPFVDAYGMHLYPDADGTEEARERRILSLLSFCRQSQRQQQGQGLGRPCSITEWGLPNTSDACPLDDERRARTVAHVREVFEALMVADRLTTAYYYDWDSETPYSVWRCGRLTAAGRAAVIPAEPAP